MENITYVQHRVTLYMHWMIAGFSVRIWWSDVDKALDLNRIRLHLRWIVDHLVWLMDAYEYKYKLPMELLDLSVDLMFFKLPEIMIGSLCVATLKCQHNGGVERSCSNLVYFFVAQIARSFQIFIVNYINGFWMRGVPAQFPIQLDDMRVWPLCALD